MHKQIRKVEKELKHSEKELKALEKKDIKRDKIVDKAMHLRGKKKKSD